MLAPVRVRRPRARFSMNAILPFAEAVRAAWAPARLACDAHNYPGLTADIIPFPLSARHRRPYIRTAASASHANKTDTTNAETQR